MANAAPAAGEFPADSLLHGLLCIKNGPRERNPRSRANSTFPFTFRPSDPFDAFKAIVQHVQHDGRPVLADVALADLTIYLKPAAGANQASYVELSSANFDAQLRRRWGNITRPTVQAWQQRSEEEGGPTTATAAFEFEFFVYRSQPATANRSLGRAAVAHRATAARRHQAAQLIDASSAHTNLGRLEREHLTTVMARRPLPADGGAATVPVLNDATTNQLRALDEAMRQHINETAREREARLSEFATLRLEINGTWLDVNVTKASLRNALDLPPWDLRFEGVNRGYVHNNNVTQGNMADVDHGAVPAPPPQPPVPPPEQDTDEEEEEVE